MADCFRLEKFAIKITKNTAVLFSGSKIYYDLLRYAFPTFHFSTLWTDQYGNYDFGVYINNIGDREREQVEKLLTLFQTAVCIDDALDSTFALDYHMTPFYEGGGRTELGELVYQAKYRKDNEHVRALLEAFEEFIQTNPVYNKANFIIGVPYYDHKEFDVPTFLATQLSSRLGIANGQQYVRKLKKTQPMKDLGTEEKFDNISGAFEVLSDNPFRGQTIIIIDDLYQSGTTLNELATTLQREEIKVLGLAATKTMRD